MAKSDNKKDRHSLRRRIKEFALDYNRKDNDKLSPTKIRKKVREELEQEDNEG